MRTTALTMNGPELALAALEHAAERFNTATEHLTAATKAVLMLAVGPLLGLAFVIAPFVGLAYIIAFPFVGFGMMVYMAVKATRK